MNKTTLDNIVIYHDQINRYNALAYTHNYIFGFVYKKNLYKATVTAEMLPFVLTLDKASRGAGYSLRFCPTAEQKELLLTHAELICSADYFKSYAAENKYNLGENFEKLVTEKAGQCWEKDNVPFTEAGDVTINGIDYQIKYEKATFCNEKSLLNLERI